MDSLVIALGTGFLVAILTEFFLWAVIKDEPKRRKHFWALTLTIASMVSAYIITTLYDLERRIDDMGFVYTQTSDEVFEDKFSRLWKAYYKNYRETPSAMGKWARDRLDVFLKQAESGSITAPRKDAIHTIEDSFKIASDFIIASNVGPLEFFLDNANYIAWNKEVLRRGVPVFRFYLYDSSNKTPEEVATYLDRAREKHYALETVKSVAFDLADEKVRSTLEIARDFVLIDNNFVSEALHIDLDGNFSQTLGTSREELLENVRKYIFDLHSLTSERANSLASVHTFYAKRESLAKVPADFYPRKDGDTDALVAQGIWATVLQRLRKQE